MKSNLILFHITFLLLIFSCQKQNHDINFINGYWEIVSVSKNNKNIKKYPFSNTIDYFEITNDLSGFRKKVKPKIDGDFNVTFHQINFEIENDKNEILLIYGKGNNFTEKILSLDSLNLRLENKEGYIFKYKKFNNKNYLNEEK